MRYIFLKLKFPAKKKTKPAGASQKKGQKGGVRRLFCIEKGAGKPNNAGRQPEL